MTIGAYTPILILTLFIFVFATGSFVGSKLLAPSRPTPAKLAPYECGIEPVGIDVSEPFPVKFYVIAMLFIVFDVESVFLFPWAVVFRNLGRGGILEMAGFVAFLLAGYVYVWKRGGLEWE
jgi:NADH-quinone oxidoreductase subunit A